MIRLLLYADINLNVMDGSAIWLQSIAKFLAGHGGECQVDLLLKQALRRSIGEQLDAADIPNLRLIAPPGDTLWDNQHAPRVIAERDQAKRYDAVIARGVRTCHQLLQAVKLDGRLWCYLTDLPQRFMSPRSSEWKRVDRIFQASQFVLCQTEAFREFFEHQWLSSCGKCCLLPPMIPTAFFEDTVAPATLRQRPLRIIYTGQIDKRWGMSMFMDTCSETTRLHLPVAFVVIGDKINAAPDDREFKGRVPEFLESGECVRAYPAMGRDEVRRHILNCSLGFCLRERVMDERFEISTKLLEYCAAGLPVLINRTAANVRLLGPDYPLYVNDTDEVVTSVRRALDKPDLLETAGRQARAAVERFRIERTSERFQPLFSVLHQRRAIRDNPSKEKILVASHDLKFYAPVRNHIENDLGARADYDNWQSLNEHDERQSRRLLQEAKTIFCEWCVGNAVWYSQNVRPDQRLFIRFHRFEITTPFPEQVVIDRVTRVIFVSEHLREEACVRFGWPPEKTAVIPNSLDCDEFRRPKVEQARFNLGMIGMLPKLKRLDLALEVTAQFVEQDPRYRLFIRGRLPWDLRWLWESTEQRQYFEECMARIRDCPALRSAVIFDGFGPDIPRWLTKIGYVLSLSDVESFHLAAAEGLASGAAALILRRPGAEQIFPGSCVFDDVSAIVESVLAAREGEFPAGETREQQQWVGAHYDTGVVEPMWRELFAAQNGQAPPSSGRGDTRRAPIERTVPDLA